MDEVFAAGRPAVVTGAASGIGLAACRRCAELGMVVAMADVDGRRLDAAAAAVAEIAGDPDKVISQVVDVARADDLVRLAGAVYDKWGDVALLMNNAAARVAGGGAEDLDAWRATMDVNFWGVVHGVRAFGDRMIAQGRVAQIVNTGSKQGITNPPSDLIYNVTKSAVKTYTEGLQHQLRTTPGCQVSAHLLVPGWTTTGDRDHNPSAWLPAQVIERMEQRLANGDFYIICPDNEVSEELDAQRFLWAAGDIAENRPALSRWHPDFGPLFEASLKDRG